jgi:hypothetical protein
MEQYKGRIEINKEREDGKKKSKIWEMGGR